jgi:hypothetical protein
VLELGLGRRAVRALLGIWIEVPSSKFHTFDSLSTGKLITTKFLDLTFCADITVTAKNIYSKFTIFTSVTSMYSTLSSLA